MVVVVAVVVAEAEAAAAAAVTVTSGVEGEKGRQRDIGLGEVRVWSSHHE